MLTAEEKAIIAAKAYVPEHSVALISAISGSEPFLVDDFLVFRNEGELILIGYPLSDDFDETTFTAVIDRLRRRFRPRRISYIAPRRPKSLPDGNKETASDDYFILDLQHVSMPPAVKRNIRNASRRLTVEKNDQMDRSHRLLIDEFVARADPGQRVEWLLDRMPAYLARRSGGIVLEARDDQRRLHAFTVIDMAPADFSAYIIGSYTRQPYVTGASDLLMSALVDLSRQAGKTYIHLGLGINEGVRRFKKKWGGRPLRPYWMETIDLKMPAIWDGIRTFLKRP